MGSLGTMDLLVHLFIVEQAVKKIFGAEKDFGVGRKAGFSNIVCLLTIFVPLGSGAIWITGLGHPHG